MLLKTSFKLNNKIHWIIISLILVVISVYALSRLKQDKLYWDENIHYPQILSFLRGDATLNPALTTIPGYNIIIAGIATITGFSSIFSIRIISTLIGYLSIYIIYLILKEINESLFVIKALQFLFFPFLFPFFYLIYTDVFSLLLILLALYTTMKKNYTIAGLYAFFSILVRQNNIVWFLFFYIFIYLQENGFTLNISSIKKHIFYHWIFIPGFIFFLLFIILNNGVAIGDQAMHPPFYFSLGNIYLILASFFFLFLPLFIQNLKKITLFLKNKKSLLVILLLFVLYIFTSTYDHPYNLKGYSALRNILVINLNLHPLFRIFFFFPIAFALISLCATKLKKNIYYIIYPASMLYLLPAKLIEPRYYIIPFILFLLFKEKNKPFMEYAQLIIFFILSQIFFYLLWQKSYII